MRTSIRTSRSRNGLSVSDRLMTRYVLGADVGGTNLRVAIVNSDGEVLHRERRPTPDGRDGNAIVESLASLAHSCIAATGNVNVDKIGIALPASGLNYPKGIVTRSPNLPGLNGLSFTEKIKELLSIDAYIENDATAATIGENWMGASRGYSNVIGITLGTGVGGGIILNGEVIRGPDGTAGEIGHVCVEPEGRACGCGSRGCLEQYSSATAVVTIAREFAEVETSSLDEVKELSAEKVYQAAIEGDAVGKRAFDVMGYYLGISLAGLINILNPEVIVLGGGLSGAWDAFIDKTVEQIEERAFREPALRVRLVRAELGDDAGTLGVARLAFASPKD
jgi:glucokinase